MLLELRAREAQVIKADKLASVGIVTSGFAQEVNAIFDTIAHQVAGFREIQPPTKECSECPALKEVCTETDRGKETVQTLLEFVHDDQFQLAPLSLHDVVESVRSLLQRQMEQSHVVFSNEIPADMPRVEGALNQLKHVFLNLFQNATQAMPRGGALSVKAALTGEGRVSVTVSDQGAGIPPDHLAQIFDPFFTTKETKEGTGLGLSIAYGVIKRHGGDIRVESLVGSGTSVYITLPIARRLDTERNVSH
jgi:signal transduction histidine kinase